MIVTEKLTEIPKTSSDKRPLGPFQSYADSLVYNRCLKGEKYPKGKEMWVFSLIVSFENNLRTKTLGSGLCNIGILFY